MKDKFEYITRLKKELNDYADHSRYTPEHDVAFNIMALAIHYLDKNINNLTENELNAIFSNEKPLERIYTTIMDNQDYTEIIESAIGIIADNYEPQYDDEDEMLNAPDPFEGGYYVDDYDYDDDDFYDDDEDDDY